MSSSTFSTFGKLAPLRSLTLGAVDYFILTFMLLISVCIGIYFGFIRKSQNTTEEYLMGDRKMKVLPIGISLVASHLSCITMMAVPAEVYAFGINHIFSELAVIFAVVFLCCVVLPVYYNNNLTTCYEYLELRFDRLTRKIVTFVYVTAYFLLFPIFNFLPSLAFSQVTHINPHLINTVLNLICVFYTMIGGIRAVVWTDVVQGTIMLSTILFVTFASLIKVGGISVVFSLAKEGGRLNPVFTFDLDTRMSIWNATSSSIIFDVSYVGFNQGCVQRLMSMPSLKQSKRSVVLFGIGFILVTVPSCLTGLVMYAYYHGCNPVLTGKVAKFDKMVPYFVQDIVGHFRGVPGLFMAGIFSAALSTVSASMNSLSGVIYFEYIRPHVKLTGSKANFIMKILICLFGVYCILGSFLVEKFSSIIEMINTIDGCTFGAIFGVFTLGMLLPRAHSRAMLTAMAISVATVLALVMASLGRVRYEHLPTLADQCPANSSLAAFTNSTSTANTREVSNPHGFNILNMAFNWYVVLGAFIVFVTGVPLSYIMPAKEDFKNFDRKLFSPIIQPFVKYQLTAQEENSKL